MISGQYDVIYVPKKSIMPAFGYATDDQAFVREDLKPRVKSFVTKHELYHLADHSKWGGWLGKEIRANVMVGIKDPVGLILTILASMNRERLQFYYQRFRLHQ